jgi:hypothetical protein
VDGLVFNEGELPFVRCLAAADSPDVWGKIPNVGVYENGALRLPGSKVLSPAEVIPSYPLATLVDTPVPYSSTRQELVATRGCYWDRCTFCTYTASHGKDSNNEGSHNFRRPGSEFIKRLMETQVAEGRNTFHFVDEAMPPGIARQLSEYIIESGLDINWGAYVRFGRPFEDKEVVELLRKSGCRMVEIGLESTSDSVLKAMDKGITVESAKKALDNFLEAGIQTHIFIMFGFPGETEADAQQTLAFMREYADKGVTFGIEVFGLMPDALAMKHMEELGIELLVPKEELKTEFYFEEDVHWRRTKPDDIGLARALEIQLEAMDIAHGANLARLREDSKLIMNAFAGTAPIAFPHVFNQSRTPDFTQVKSTETFVLDAAGSDKAEIQDDVAYSLVRVLHANFLVPNNVMSFIREFTTRTDMPTAIDRYCASQSLDSTEQREQLRTLIRTLARHNILITSSEVDSHVSKVA